MTIDYDSLPINSEKRYDDETKSMRWEILINGWSAGNSATLDSALAQGKWLVSDPGGRATLARLGFTKRMFLYSPEGLDEHRKQQLREHRERRRQG